MDSRATYTGVDNLGTMRAARNYNRFLGDLVQAHAGAARAIVDFGAGTGTFALAMRRRGFTVHCIEQDPVLVERLRGSGFQVDGELSALPAGRAAFIYTLNVLEHIKDDYAALVALRNALQPGGRLLVYVPAFMLLFSSLDRKVGHWHRYRRGSLVKLATSAGFRVESARYADALGFFATLLFRVAGNRHGRINARGLRVFDRLVFPASRLLDRITGRFFGKNLVIVAVRPR